MNDINKITLAIKSFPFWDYGMDDVDPTDLNAEWVPALAELIVLSLGDERHG